MRTLQKKLIEQGALGIHPASTFLEHTLILRLNLFAGLRSITLDFEII